MRKIMLGLGPATGEPEGRGPVMVLWRSALGDPLASQKRGSGFICGRNMI